MPHRHKPHRSKKVNRLYSDDEFVSESAEDAREKNEILEEDNQVTRMSSSEIDAVQDVIYDRWKAAEKQTSVVSDNMDRWDKQYKGEWYTQEGLSEGQIFLRKTMEQVKTVYSNLLSTISDLSPLVSFDPIVSSIDNAPLEEERGVLVEALVNYTLNDLLRFKEDILPPFLKSFLKFPMGVLKLTWRPEAARPDFHLDVIDRSTLYIDPFAKRDIKNAAWVMERYGLPRREVIKRINDGYYALPPGKTIDDIMSLPIYYGNDGTFYPTSTRVERNVYHAMNSLEIDDDIEIVEYWQSPDNGLSDVYAVNVGGVESGIILRYGPNPYPYKKHPYFGKSYSPDDIRVDGEGLVQEMEGIQAMVNTFLNLRVEDMRENVINRVYVDEGLIDSQTQDDFAKNQKLVRLNKEYIDAMRRENPNYSPANGFVPLPISPSTQELWQDINFLLQQSKETTGVNDAIAGNTMDRTLTATQYTHTLSRATGNMRPVLLQIAALIEEVSMAIFEYYKDPDFFGEERILQIVGSSKYRQSISDLYKLRNGNLIRQISPDDMLVDGNMVAVNGFEDQINKQVSMNSAVSILQAISVNPDMYADAKKQINFGKLTEIMIENSGIRDKKSIIYSPEEQAQIAQAAVLEQQRAREEQMQLFAMQQEAKEREIELKSLNKQAEDQNKAISEANKEITVDTHSNNIKLQSDLIRDASKIDKQTESDIEEMNHEARLERLVDRPVGNNNINQ